MSKFLVSTDLEGGSSHHIKLILSGKDVRIASAFLGKGAEEKVLEGTRLICDIGMGGTNPAALKALSKKLGENLKCLSDFHAKTYLSDKGCLVGSANLSSRGVGFLSPAKLIEAAILVAPDDPAAKLANEWFEDIWNEARIVGPMEIKLAEQAWSASKRGTPQGGSKYETFLDALKYAKTGVAGEWKFLLTREQLSKSEKKAIEDSEDEVVRIASWKPQGKLDYFTNISKRKKLDGYYISLHRGARGKLYLNAMKFIGNLKIPSEDGKIKVSYFAILPWLETGIPKITTSELNPTSPLSTAIENENQKYFGRALSAEAFAKIIKKGDS